MNSKKRRRLTLKEKMQIINIYDAEKLGVRDLANEETDIHIDVVDSDITSYEELKGVSSLKLFAKKSDGYIGFQLAKNIEIHYENLLISNKKLRQTSMLDFVNKT
jgi:hypothetical protein